MKIRFDTQRSGKAMNPLACRESWRRVTHPSPQPTHPKSLCNLDLEGRPAGRPMPGLAESRFWKRTMKRWNRYSWWGMGKILVQLCWKSHIKICLFFLLHTSNVHSLFTSYLLDDPHKMSQTSSTGRTQGWEESWGCTLLVFLDKKNVFTNNRSCFDSAASKSSWLIGRFKPPCFQSRISGSNK